MNCRRTLDDSPTGTLESGGGGREMGEVQGGRERVDDKVGA